MISFVRKFFKMLQYCRDYPSPAKSWILPSYAEKITKLQALQAFLSNEMPL